MFKYCTKSVWFLVVLQESYTSDYWSQRLILFILLFLLQLPSSHSLSHPALLVVERSEVNERACLVIKSMKSTEKRKCQTVVLSFTFALLPEAPMIVAGGSDLCGAMGGPVICLDQLLICVIWHVLPN